MVIHVRNAKTDQVVRELASKLGLSIPKAVLRAVEKELYEMDLAEASTKEAAPADKVPAALTKTSDPDHR